LLEHWPQGLQIGFPNSMVSLFPPLGQYKAIKVRHLLGAWGHIENIFSISALTPNVKPLVANFNFCTNKNV
jgi:hypothetical protein